MGKKNIELINYDHLEEFYGDDKEFMLSMIKLFLQNSPKYIAAMNDAFEQRNWPALYRHAFKIKPAFGMVGLVKLQMMAEELEELSKRRQNHDEEKINLLLNRLVRENEMAIHNLKNLIKNKLL